MSLTVVNLVCRLASGSAVVAGITAEFTALAG